MDGIDTRLADILNRGWALLLLRGLVAIAFGVLTWVSPDISLAALVFLFGFYALLDGTLAAWTAIAGRKEVEHWWVLLLGGLLGIAVGVATFATPRLTALALLLYIAGWAIAKGIIEIVVAIRVRKEIRGEWRLILAGLVSVAFGVFLIARPGVGALAVLWLIATYAVLVGILLVMLAFKARGFTKRLTAV